jgi:hypothetical protein
MFRDDDRRDLLQSFERRGYLLSDAGQFEMQDERAQSEQQTQAAREAATTWRRSLGAGDTVPGHDAYDYEAMARDEVWPKPDGAGRVPLSPRYWKPGRMVLAGYDLATGRRILSSAPLEERLLSGQIDTEPDAEDIDEILSQATPEDFAELAPAERRSLESWMESHGVVLAQGGTGTMTDAGPGYGMRPDGSPKGSGFLGPLKNKRGETMTEYSIGVNIDGKEMDIPTLVPTLSPDEVQAVLSIGPNDPLPESIVQKAAAHAKQRIAAGKPVFAGPDESPKQTRVGRAGVPYRKPSRNDFVEPAVALLDSLAGVLRGGVAQTLGLPGDIESLVRMLTGGDNVMPTTEDMNAKLPPVVPPSVSDLVTGKNPREFSADLGQAVGEIGGLGKAPSTAVKGVTTAVKAAKKRRAKIRKEPDGSWTIEQDE